MRSILFEDPLNKDIFFDSLYKKNNRKWLIACALLVLILYKSQKLIKNYSLIH